MVFLAGTPDKVFLNYASEKQVSNDLQDEFFLPFVAQAAYPASIEAHRPDDTVDKRRELFAWRLSYAVVMTMVEDLTTTAAVAEPAMRTKLLDPVSSVVCEFGALLGEIEATKEPVPPETGGLIQQAAAWAKEAFSRVLNFFPTTTPSSSSNTPAQQITFAQQIMSMPYILYDSIARQNDLTELVKDWKSRWKKFAGSAEVVDLPDTWQEVHSAAGNASAIDAYSDGMTIQAGDRYNEWLGIAAGDEIHTGMPDLLDDQRKNNLCLPVLTVGETTKLFPPQFQKLLPGSGRNASSSDSGGVNWFYWLQNVMDGKRLLCPDCLVITVPYVDRRTSSVDLSGTFLDRFCINNTVPLRANAYSALYAVESSQRIIATLRFLGSFKFTTEMTKKDANGSALPRSRIVEQLIEQESFRCTNHLVVLTRLLACFQVDNFEGVTPPDWVSGRVQYADFWAVLTGQKRDEVSTGVFRPAYRKDTWREQTYHVSFLSPPTRDPTLLSNKANAEAAQDTVGMLRTVLYAQSIDELPRLSDFLRDLFSGRKVRRVRPSTLTDSVREDTGAGAATKKRARADEDLSFGDADFDMEEGDLASRIRDSEQDDAQSRVLGVEERTYGMATEKGVKSINPWDFYTSPSTTLVNSVLFRAPRHDFLTESYRGLTRFDERTTTPFWARVSSSSSSTTESINQDRGAVRGRRRFPDDPDDPDDRRSGVVINPSARVAGENASFDNRYYITPPGKPPGPDNPGVDAVVWERARLLYLADLAWFDFLLQVSSIVTPRDSRSTTPQLAVEQVYEMAFYLHVRDRIFQLNDESRSVVARSNRFRLVFLRANCAFSVTWVLELFRKGRYDVDAWLLSAPHRALLAQEVGRVHRDVQWINAKRLRVANLVIAALSDKIGNMQLLVRTKVQRPSLADGHWEIGGRTMTYEYERIGDEDDFPADSSVMDGNIRKLQNAWTRRVIMSACAARDWSDVFAWVRYAETSCGLREDEAFQSAFFDYAVAPVLAVFAMYKNARHAIIKQAFSSANEAQTEMGSMRTVALKWWLDLGRKFRRARNRGP